MGGGKAPRIPDKTAEELRLMDMQGQLLAQQLAADRAKAAQEEADRYATRTTAMNRLGLGNNEAFMRAWNSQDWGNVDATIAAADAQDKQNKKDQTDWNDWQKSRKGAYDQAITSAHQALADAGLQDRYGDVDAAIYKDYDYNAIPNLERDWRTIDPTTGIKNDYTSSLVSGVRTGRRDASLNEATTNATERLKALGEYDNLFGKWQSAADTRKNALGTGANDYSKSFDDILDSVLSNTSTARRTDYTNKLKAGIGDPYLQYADTADDSIINDILGKGRQEVTDTLTRAKTRGTINDIGYNAGMQRIDDLYKTGQATANTLGGTVLSKDRDTLSGIKDTALARAGAYSVGDTFNPDDYLNQYTAKNTDLGKNLEGDVRGALAGQTFFDISDILGKAGMAQGPQNTRGTANSVLGSPFATDPADNKKKDRGLGGVSTF